MVVKWLEGGSKRSAVSPRWRSMIGGVAAIFMGAASFAQPCLPAIHPDGVPRYGSVQTHLASIVKPNPVRGSPISMAHGDFDGDGDADVAALGYDVSCAQLVMCNDLVVLRNGDSGGSGGGVLTSAQTFVDLPLKAVAVAASDIDGDGDLDLITANLNGTVGVFLNSGQGDFAPPVTVPTGTEPQAVEAADLTGDGRPDLVTLDRVSNTLTILENQTVPGGSPTFLKLQQLPIQTPPLNNSDLPRARFSCGDIDGDGDLDVAFPAGGGVRFALNDGTGHVTQWPTKYFLDGPVHGVELADLDLDGRLDVLSYSYVMDTFCYFMNKGGSGSGGWAGLGPLNIISLWDPTWPNYHQTSCITVGDFDADGAPDVAFGNSGVWGVMLLMNAGPGHEPHQQFRPGQFVPGVDDPMPVHAGDLNGDGADELMVGSENGKRMRIDTYLGIKGTGVQGGRDNVTHNKHNSQANSMYGSQHPAWVDLNNDGRLDAAVAAGHPSRRGLFVSYANINGDLEGLDFYEITAAPPSGQPAPLRAIPIDANADGWTDIAVAVSTFKRFPGTVQIFMNDGKGGLLTPPVTYDLYDRRPFNGTPADIDLDGDTDLVILCLDPYLGPYVPTTTRGLIVMRNDGRGQFTVEPPYDLVEEPFFDIRGLAVGDLDGDGLSDAATLTTDLSPTGPGTLYIALNKNGAFAETRALPIATFPQDVAAIDFDGDRDLDLAVSFTVSTQLPDSIYLQILINDGQANFSIAQSFVTSEDYTRWIKAVSRPDRGEILIFTESSGVWVHAFDMATGALKHRTAYTGASFSMGFDVKQDGGPLDLVFSSQDGWGQLLTLRDLSCEEPPCPADCDGSGALDINDFICFQTFFVLGEPNADCDASGQLNIDDFICFQTKFLLGCP